jgi:hypothetical protein
LSPSAERGVGCDLLGVAAEIHEAQREAAASALLAVGESEDNGDVQWSIACALGATVDRRFLPEHTTAVSLLDRLLHHASVVDTAGDSYRMREARARGGTQTTKP